jgi:Cu+-exporting ATPase
VCYDGRPVEFAEVMPYEPSVPCATCTEGVDPLRAPAVLAVDAGFRYFCCEACRTRYRSQGTVRRPTIPQGEAEALMHSARGEELTRLIEPDEVLPLPPVREPRAPAGVWPVPAAFAVALVGLVPGQLFSTLAALALTALAGIVAGRAPLTREESGMVAWIAAPTGVSLLSLAALFGASKVPLFAAAFGIGILWAREWLARRYAEPIDALLRELRASVPRHTRMSLVGGDDAAPVTRAGETAAVRTGEDVLVEAGDVVPVDGVVAEGVARVLPHPTAQQPTDRSAGQALLAGARVLDGSVRLTATRVGEARALFRPQSFGQETGPGAASIARAATRVRSPVLGLLFVAAVAGLALTFGSDAGRLLAGIGAALVAFPVFAIVRGVKLPFVSASALGASRGMVFRDAATLERAGRVSAAALCTDGTVTQGDCTLVEVSPLGRDQDGDQLTAMAMGAELSAETHPLADAVRRYGEERRIQPLALRRVAYQRGRGVTGLVDGGGALVLGNRHSLLASGVSVAVADREAQKAESQGRTVVFLAVGGRVRALFVFEDPVRPEARAAVQRLIDLDVEVVLLSGDHRATVESLARTVDITHVKAELTSEERAAEVGRLREAGGVVAVLGRASADELPLTAADIALTLDAAGGAHEGDVAVASGDLRDAADALVIAQRARRTAQNVLSVGLGGGIVLCVASALCVVNPLLTLLCASCIDAWALPSAAQLLRRGARPRGALRGPAGWFRRV